MSRLVDRTFPTGILVHQPTYTKKILKCFYMNKAHPLSSSMIVRSLDVKNDPFRPYEKDEELLGPEVSYLSVIGVLMYLANFTRPDIVFPVHLSAKYRSTPTQRHRNGIKHILCYFQGTTDMNLFTQRNQSNNCLDMLMQDTFQTHIRRDHKHDMCLIVMELLFHGDLLSKQW